jgi:hypothetical protein
MPMNGPAKQSLNRFTSCAIVVSVLTAGQQKKRLIAAMID